MRRKILFLITKSNFGGAQRYVLELAQGLPSDEYEVIVAFGGEGVLKQKLEAAGIRTIRIEHLERDISIVKEIRSVFELGKLCRKERPDIIHLNSSKAGGIGALVARLAGVPRIVYTTHGWAFLEPRGRVWRALAWFASWVTALLSHAVIVVSHYELRHTNMPFVHRKLRVIHTALPPIDFMPRERARASLFSEDVCICHEKDVWLVTTAELNRNKNLFAALDAVADFNTRNEWKIFYTIIGEGELQDELLAYIRERGLEGQVTLLGYIDDARMYLKAFDMFLLPSHKEGLPYALLEAGAAELPSIAARVGGIPEVITDHMHGLLVDSRNADTITTALATFVFDPVLRTNCSNAFAQKTAEEFSLSRMVEATLRVYNTN